MKICPRCMKKLEDGELVVDVTLILNQHHLEEVVHIDCVSEELDWMEYPDDAYGEKLHRNGGVPSYPYREEEVSEDGYHNPYGDPRQY